MDPSQLYLNNLQLLVKAGIEYRQYDHEPVLSYEKAREIRERFRLRGIESKSLFLKLKDGRYCMFVSVEGERFDATRIKQLLGSKPSICSDNELVAKTGCVPKCACPFGHSSDIILIIDQKIFGYERFIYSPGLPDKTIEVLTEDIHRILSLTPNVIVSY